MRFKTLFVTTILLINGLTSIAQAYKQNIQKRFDEFYQLMAAGKTEESMEYIPDPFFSIIPKDQMIAVTKQLMNSKEISYKVLDYKITEITDAKLIEKNYYATLKYVSNLTMKFNEVDTIKTAEARKTRLNLLRLAFANSYGSDNVKVNEETGVFSIAANKKSFAISPNGQTDWKFINAEPRQRLLMEKILPKELIDTL